MKKCKCQRKRKHFPYGTKAVTGWCMNCDMGPNWDISKSGERQKVKREIKKELTLLQL